MQMCQTKEQGKAMARGQLQRGSMSVLPILPLDKEPAGLGLDPGYLGAGMWPEGTEVWLVYSASNEIL